MDIQNNIDILMEQVKNNEDDKLRECIEEWFQKIRTQSMKLGAQFIAAGCFGAIQKNLNKPKPSLRDYERCIKDIRKIIAVQLTKQNDSKEAKPNEAVEETANDGTAE